LERSDADVFVLDLKGGYAAAEVEYISGRGS
jgi:hypothetical protein